MSKLYKSLLIGLVGVMALTGCSNNNDKPKDEKVAVENKQETESKKEVKEDVKDTDNKSNNEEKTDEAQETKKTYTSADNNLDSVMEIIGDKGLENFTLEDLNHLEYEVETSDNGDKTYIFNLKDGGLKLTSTKDDKEGHFTFMDLREADGAGYTINLKTKELSNVVNSSDISEEKSEKTDANEDSNNSEDTQEKENTEENKEDTTEEDKGGE